MRVTVFKAVAALALAAASPALALAGAVPLAPYLAEYELVLEGQPEATEIVAVSGRLVLEFSGAACVGYSNDARIVTEIETADGGRVVTDARTRTVETADGELEFFNETYADGERVEFSVGTARRDGSRLLVALTEPAPRTLSLEGELAFPTEHVFRVLDAARRKETLATVDVYDGSQDGSLIFQTAAVIGGARTNPTDYGDGEDAIIRDGGFANMRHWPVTISFFEKQDVRADATPDFMLSFLLYENGVTRSYTIDFGDFELRGRITRLEMLPVSEC